MKKIARTMLASDEWSPGVCTLCPFCFDHTRNYNDDGVMIADLYGMNCQFGFSPHKCQVQEIIFDREDLEKSTERIASLQLLQEYKNTLLDACFADVPAEGERAMKRAKALEIEIYKRMVTQNKESDDVVHK